MKTIKLLVITILILNTYLLNAQINTDAGLVVSPIKNAIISASSGTNIEFIRDGNPETFWESGNALPDNYISSREQNIFLNDENYSVESIKYIMAFDGNPDSKADIEKGVTKIKLYNKKALKFLSLKLNTNSEVLMQIVFSNGQVLERKYNSQNNFAFQNLEINESSYVKEIIFQSAETYQIFELAAVDKDIVEWIKIEFPSPVEIGIIMSRHLNSTDVDSIQLLYSNNNIDWIKISNLNPQAIAFLSMRIHPEIYAKYLKINIFIKPVPYKKASYRELAIYDRYGEFGKPAAATKSLKTWKESFGVNAIWGWGYGVSSKQIGKNDGSAKFARLTNLVRSYHRLDWDIAKPGNTAEFLLREKSIDSIKNKWLNWKEEYGIWKSNGLKIDACILFNNDYFPQSGWDNAYYQARQYGAEFAGFFSENELVSLVEVGNEPWDYSSSLYAEILKGMSTGIKNTSKSFRVIPCGLQAYDKHLYLNNYISDYILPNNDIDGLNTHIYSYIFNEQGERVAINPEDPRSETWSVNNLKKWAIANNYSTDIYVTEFGFDSDGGGDDCIHSNCVSEYEQAVYGLRQALIFSRLGVEEFYWYFYANVDWNSILHNRSGLLSSYSSGFKEKLSFTVFERVFEVLKDMQFSAIVLEDDETYCYSYINENTNEEVMIAWRPTSENHKDIKWVDIPLKKNVKSITDITNPDTKVSYKKEINKLKIALSGTPLIIILR